MFESTIPKTKKGIKAHVLKHMYETLPSNVRERILLGFETDSGKMILESFSLIILEHQAFFDHYLKTNLGEEK